MASQHSEKIQVRIEQLKSQLEQVTHSIQQAMAQQNAIAGAIAELQNAQSYLSDETSLTTSLPSTKENDNESEETREEERNRKEERNSKETSQEVKPLNESECA